MSYTVNWNCLHWRRPLYGRRGKCRATNDTGTADNALRHATFPWIFFSQF